MESKYLTIKQAKIEYADYSNEWYMLRIRAGDIKAIGGGHGSKWQIERESLESYLSPPEDETVWPMR